MQSQHYTRNRDVVARLVCEIVSFARQVAGGGNVFMVGESYQFGRLPALLETAPLSYVLQNPVNVDSYSVFSGGTLSRSSLS